MENKFDFFFLASDSRYLLTTAIKSTTKALLNDFRLYIGTNSIIFKTRVDLKLTLKYLYDSNAEYSDVAV